jgi:hypothetical protein
MNTGVLIVMNNMNSFQLKDGDWYADDYSSKKTQQKTIAMRILH